MTFKRTSPPRVRRVVASSLLGLMALSLAGCGEPEDTLPGQPIAHRRAAFKDMLRTFEPMGVMLRTDNYRAEKFQAHLSTFKALRDGPWPYFTAGTLQAPSHATAAVWEQPEKFEQARQDFQASIDRLVAVDSAADVKIVAKAYEDVQNNCASCHKTFKTR